VSNAKQRENKKDKEVLVPGAVIFECKDGPYGPLGGEDVMAGIQQNKR
jgi:L-aminopeptidase/D-esterase-like protein